MGAERREIPTGTQLVAILNQTQVGFLRWTNGAADKAFLPLISNPDLKELRDSQGDADPSDWEEKTIGGQPKDPWQPAILLPFVNPKTCEAFTFSTSSLGGRRSAKQLIRGCVRQIRAAPETTRNHLPLVELGESHYVHPTNKSVGKLFNPEFAVVDWVPISDIAEALKHAGFDIINRDLGVEPTAA
jgi:hypothetical protein